MPVGRLATLLLTTLGLTACESAAPQCDGPPPWPGNAPLHEPPGFHMLSDYTWNQMRGDGWSYLRRTSSKKDDICVDPSTPAAPPPALRFCSPPALQPNPERSGHWFPFPL